MLMYNDSMQVAIYRGVEMLSVFWLQRRKSVIKNQFFSVINSVITDPTGRTV